MNGLITRRIRRRADIDAWHGESDVIVVGLGAAGACAAIEAAEAGARVRALECESEGGGTSSVSAGQIYMGGGTPLQRSCGFSDTPDEMFRYLMATSGPGAPEDKIRLYCERSVEHYEWLVARGVPFKHSYVPPSVAMNPATDDGLSYTGSELAYPYRNLARPAPRGHNVQHEGSSGGMLMRVLLDQVVRAGVTVETEARAEALVIDDANRVVGIVSNRAGREQCWYGGRGVVVTTGGFASNREMVRLHAPQFSSCLAVGPETNDGSGILLCAAAGGHAISMDATFVAIPFAKPPQLIKGILVGSDGRRYINEDVYQAVHGNVAVQKQNGCVFLIVDASIYAEPEFPIPIAASAPSPEALEARLEMPAGNLCATLATYNESAAKSEDPLFHKSAEWLTPLVQPPYTAFDLRLSALPYPFFTLGGIHTSSSGEVLSAEREPISGLFAAGRTTSGLFAHGDYSSGLAIADATFFGRLAGQTAAAAPRIDAHSKLDSPQVASARTDRSAGL